MILTELLRAQVNAAFRFVVTVNGVPQAAFTECTLPAIDLEIEEVKEGGLNSYTHQLPGRRRATKVVLKNGVGKSPIMAWYVDMEEVYVCRNGRDVKTSFPDGMLAQLERGAEFGRCAFID